MTRSHGDETATCDAATWRRLVASVGMRDRVSRRRGSPHGLFFHVVLERDRGGLSSEGTGDTLEEAYRRAANGQSLDWAGALGKMRDRDCEGMMHL